MTDTDLIARADALFERIITSNVDPFPALEVATAAIDLRDALAAANAREATLKAERDRLRDALQTFADAADELDELGMDAPYQQAPVTYDDCAAARAALTGEPQP